MSKFLVVKEIPKELNEGEFAIDKPSFITQVREHSAKKPKNGLTGAYYLRMIIDSIAYEYAPGEMTAYSIKVHNYEGRPFSSDEDINNIIVEALKSDYPNVFQYYLDRKIKSRPSKTSLIYYVDSGIKNQYEIFYKNGLSEYVEEKKSEDKPKKTVGKPAITKEQAEALKNQADS